MNIPDVVLIWGSAKQQEGELDKVHSLKSTLFDACENIFQGFVKALMKLEIRNQRYFNHLY